VTDRKYQYTGVDKICPFCGQPNSAAANFCKECGGDLSAAKQAVVRAAREMLQV
jgi:predicted amidophosphoribosyltransferase